MALRKKPSGELEVIVRVKGFAKVLIFVAVYFLGGSNTMNDIVSPMGQPPAYGQQYA